MTHIFSLFIGPKSPKIKKPITRTVFISAFIHFCFCLLSFKSQQTNRNVPTQNHHPIQLIPSFTRTHKINKQRVSSITMTMVTRSASRSLLLPRTAPERVAELFDEKLFKQPLPNEDCPICYLRLPIEGVQNTHQSCCGKMLCDGCVRAHSVAAADTERYKCVFCRTEAPSSDEEHIERMKKRVEANDAQAMFNLGTYYILGMNGLRQDHWMTLELYHESAKLGNKNAHFALSLCYQTGRTVEKDTRKETYHLQLGAMGGDVCARYNLGCNEDNAGNMDRAFKHWMISANDGYDVSMKAVQEGYEIGFVTKDDYAKTIRAYYNSIAEMKSDDRDRAAAACLSKAE